jgi:excisionase family DNA binding protein
MGDWLTVEEAATLAGYHENHIRRLVRAGEVKARKVVIVWLVSRKSLDAYLRRQDKQGERRGRKKLI